MNLNFSDDEGTALIRELADITVNGRHPLLPRIHTMK
jgi:hypothetical protein